MVRKRGSTDLESGTLDQTERFVRRLPGRLRIYINGLQRNESLATLLKRYCMEIPGVISVTVGTATGRVLLLFDANELQHGQLEQRLLELEYRLSHQAAFVAAAQEQPSTEGTLAVKVDWHSLAPSEILDRLQSHGQQGLSSNEVANRHHYFGKNTMPEAAKLIWYKTLVRQFFNFTTITMISIAALPIFMGRVRDTAGVLFILGVNAIIGTYQEQKAQKDIRALKQLAVYNAKVIRSDVETEILASELVPGDILILEAGDRIPADAILLDSWNVEIDESSLTGESMPVVKASAVVCGADTPLAERNNMVFMGSFVTRGRARAVVVATGHKTEMGQLITVLQNVENRVTPLQKRLNVVARTMTLSALVIAAAVVVVRFAQGYTLIDTLMTGVSVATTAISEGLPIMITVALVAGMRRMVRHKAVVRKLSSLETLAKVDVICCDKTGTMTKNKMTVRKVMSIKKVWAVEDDDSQREGLFLEDGKPISVDPTHDLFWLATIACVCNDAVISQTDINDGQSGSAGESIEQFWNVQGDPTEIALLMAAVKAGVSTESSRSKWNRVFELPFDSDRRRMTVVCKNLNGEYVVFTKGSVDVLLQRSHFTVVDGMECKLDTRLRTSIIEQERQAAKQAMRVLAVAYKKLDEEPQSLSADELEKDLVFAGMFAMMDPPRDDVKESIAFCRNSGVQVVMITGDHPVTAEAIGKELGFSGESNRVLTGADLSRMSEEELMAATEHSSIFSRVSPIDKQRIVTAFQKRGLIVAMTGDGVNDAPALKQADVGIALGRSGSDVAKEASSLIVTDDQFSTIIKAIRQGRSVLGSIRSTIGYIFTGNFAEVLYAAMVVASGLPLPLMPLQMMFMNMLTDSLPTMALILGQPVSNKNQTVDQPLLKVRDVFDSGLIARVVASGLTTGIGTTALFMAATALTGNPALAGTMALATLCLGKLTQAPYWRRSGSEPGMVEKDLIMRTTLGISTVGLLAAIYVPQLQFLFNSVPLGIHHWAVILATVYMSVKVARPLEAGILAGIERRQESKRIQTHFLPMYQ